MLLIHLVLIVITSQIMELSNFTITDEIFSPDSGVCTYYTSGGDNDLRYWFRGIDKHNTLSIGKQNIKKAAGKLLKSEEGATELVVF